MGMTANLPNMTDDLADVVETLRARRADHVASVELLDQAIANLMRLMGSPAPVPRPAPSAPPTSNGADEFIPRIVYAHSVKRAAVDLLNEENRDWSAEEILLEYETRGTPIGAVDARNAMFSALSRLAKEGLIVRPSHGRYRAKKWTDAAGPAAANDGDVLGRPFVQNPGFTRPLRRPDSQGGTAVAT